MNDNLRAFSWRRQGLSGTLARATPAEVLARTGWSRSVGGANPYLALRARAGLGRAAVDAAVAAGEICELPAARGCTYVVPAADYALALQAGAGAAESDIAAARKHLGVTDRELDRLASAVLDATARAPLDPRELKDAVGDKVRNLGDAGKKKGLTTTLPLVLGRLQSAGELRRVPVNGRLDQQRYRYARWQPSPIAQKLEPAELAVELARRYFRWAAPATVAQFGWWSGLGAKERRSAAGDLGLVSAGPVDDDDDERLVFPDDSGALTVAPPREPDVAFVGSIDNLFHLRREVTPLSAAERHGPASTSVADLEHHAIVDRGSFVGVWEYDPSAGQVVFATFHKLPAASKAAASLSAWIAAELGDARSFSLDSPESRGGRIAAVHKLRVR
jgi:Winged helix DNA-binding domain